MAFGFALPVPGVISNASVCVAIGNLLTGSSPSGELLLFDAGTVLIVPITNGILMRQMYYFGICAGLLWGLVGSRHPDLYLPRVFG